MAAIHLIAFTPAPTAVPTSVSSDLRPNSFATGCFLAVFGIVWSAGVLTFDSVQIWSAFRQIAALNYASAPGRITHSAVKTTRSSRGRAVYRPDIKYSFEVDGKTHEGSLYRYGQPASNDKSASIIVQQHPVGAAVTVYYNPADPADSLLHPGLTGTDLFIALFLLPFNVVMLGLWWQCADRMFLRWRKHTAGGAPISDDGFQVRVCLTTFSPLTAGLAAAGALGFLAIFAIGLTLAFSPSLELMVVVWSVILAAGVLAYAARRMRLASGACDLVINTVDLTIQLPQTAQRKEVLAIPIADITGLDLETISKRSSKGRTSYCYAPAIFFTTSDGQKRKELLIEWFNQNRARELAGWIGERLQSLGWQQR
jgi:hypothetical protein